jgi:uncharacterized protein (DUF433 family)
MASEIALDELIAITPGVSGGKPRIANRRITVEDIAIWHERLGLSADQIASEYALSLAEIYAALAYYFAHREAIERSMREGQTFVETMRQAHPSLVKQ